MQKYLDAERARLDDMVKQVEKDVAAGLSKIQEARKRKNKKVGKTSASTAWLKVGAKVWVADEDDFDPEADQCVWEATVVSSAKNRKLEGKLTKGWWSLDFGEGVLDYDYIYYNIFETEMDAQLNLLVV